MLVRSLYARPRTLAIAAFNGVASGALVAFLSGNSLLCSLAFLMCSIAILRVVNAIHMADKPDDISTGKLEFAYRFGAFSYAATLGVFAGLTMTLNLSPLLQVLMISNAIGYGIGISAHNAARPRIALGQLLLATLPIVAAAVSLGTPASILLAINLFCLIPAMIGITFSIFRTLNKSITAAQRSDEMAHKMETLALTDPVTGLDNRVGLDAKIGPMFASLADGQKLGLFWIDLDRFKEINDLHGHHTGDAVLHEMGIRIAALLGDRGIVARFAGDEFVIARPLSDPREASMLASAIMREMTRPIRTDGLRLEVEGSIGIATSPDDGTDTETLMQHADIALFHAKADGRRQMRFFDPAMTRALAHRRDMESELRMALRRDELSVYFQPIVDLSTGRVRCFEALVRWFHPERGEITPDEFIPIAEECGAIVTLGNWLTGHAARVAANWPDDVQLAVNLSPMQIKAPGAALGILSALKDAQLPPERLELEVTENLFLEDSPAIELFIEELSAASVRFALDDFGTGYSSLGYINQWPFSKIKVDRSFVSGPQAGRKSDAIIRAVSQMGKSLGIEIVAEGLETIDQVRAVRDAGCTLGQGFHFSRAVPDYQAALLLAEERGTAPGDWGDRLAG
ncbi:putative bifunctional diguanylate cyclase/phosphodiesterase [Qipengyuania marisflavi]|uniref:putative bifunctional diguanylate cyclase/phosphodiesterase n=1 Tax=Qipengyuania marisflavi TaxID=2486356 RepID=UPI001FEB2AF5|nr:EAL domain-containing protein [Qipengyuania marisflavi]